MKNKMKTLLLTTLSLPLTACMTTQNLTPENKSAIHKITVNKTVAMPTDMRYLGPGFGYVGMLSVIAGKSTGDKIKNTADANHIEVNKIFRNQMISDIKHNTHLTIVDQGNADADLQLKVVSYGFSIPQGFSFEVVPTMVLEAKLVQKNSVVWQNYYNVTPLFQGMKSYTPDQLIHNPAYIASSWNAAAKKASENLVRELS